jgi:hypothetical protein
MKILFLGSDDRRVGSARIWIHDLSAYLSDLGYETAVNDEKHLDRFDVIILGKGSLGRVFEIKQRHPHALVGNINFPIVRYEERPKSLGAAREIDFFIAGSIEEMDRILWLEKPVFQFPLIERMFSGGKIHSDHLPIVLGYHGNGTHIEEFYPHLKKAIEILAKEIPVKLIAIFPRPGGNPDWKWRTGKPAIAAVEEVDWQLQTIEDQLLRCDIGLVPGIVHISHEERKPWFKELEAREPGRPRLGGAGPYLLRFKGFSNAGRALVFHQLGIPVVACFMPSHFHILGNPECGYLAHSTEGWLRALRELSASAKRRREIADAAFTEFQRLYDPLSWAKRLYGQISELLTARGE